MPLDVSQLTPEQLAALLAQNSSSTSTTPDVDAALSTPTPPTAAPDRSGITDQIQDYINKAVPSSAVQNMVDAAAGKPGSMSPSPGEAIVSSENTDLPTDVTPEPTGDTGLSPSVDQNLSAMTQSARDALASGSNAASPNQEQQQESSPIANGPIAKNGPAPATPGAPATTPNTANTDYLGNMLSKLYGPGTDANALKQAMQTRGTSQMINNLGMSDQMIAAALSRGRFKPDYAVNAEIAQQANNPVNNILQQRQAQEGQIGTALKLSDFNDKQMAQDPNSPLSQSARAMALQLNPKLQTAPGFNSMDYEAIVKLQPMVDTSLKAQSLAVQKQYAMQYKQQQASAKAQFDIPSKIDNFINNRGATKLAADADRRVDQVKDILAPYMDDLNNVPAEILPAMRQEMEQIFKGGAATEGSTAHLMPPGLQSKWAQLQEYVTQNPSGAGMGPMIQEFLPYLDALQQNSRAYIGQAIKPQLQGAEAQITDPVTYQRFHANYDKYNNAAQTKQANQQALSQVNPPPKSAPGSTPHDAAAIAWAKANINNPDPKIKSQALQFIKMNGG